MKSNTFLACLATVALGGCVVGQELPMDYGTAPGEATESNRVSVEVDDNRRYVLSGEKDPSFIGKYRGGFGVPFDVSTANDVPLAEVLAAGITDALLIQGFGASANPDRTISVTIREWNFDGYQNGRFWYELEVQVNSPLGLVLEPFTVNHQQYIDGTFWKGAKGGFERQMPRLYKQAIDKIVTRNPDVLEALRSKN